MSSQMWLLVICNLGLWVSTMVGYIIYNLFQKNKKLESMIISQQQIIDSISELINSGDQIINSLEISGAFKADDEAGAFFKVLKNIQEELNYFKASSNG
jgi:hypothetical protein